MKDFWSIPNPCKWRCDTITITWYYVFLQSSSQIRTWNIPHLKKKTSSSELRAGSGISYDIFSFPGKKVDLSISQDLQLFCFPRDPITLSLEEQGVYNHLRNAWYLGSMKPFSGSVIGSLNLIIFPFNQVSAAHSRPVTWSLNVEFFRYRRMTRDTWEKSSEFMGLGGIRQGGYGMATVGLIKPLFLRRYVRGGRLTSHEHRGKSSECLCELIQTDLNGSYSQHFLIWRVSSKIITNRVFSLLGSGSKTICIYKYIFEIHVYIYIVYTYLCMNNICIYIRI